MVANSGNRFWHIRSLTQENAGVASGNYPRYVIRPKSSPTPSVSLEITITPASYTETMTSSQSYLDFTYYITVSGIPANQTVSGGNTYPDLTRVYNTGWSYTDYTVSGTTYRQATKTQTLRYERVGTAAYTTTKHMYFNLSFSTGSVSTDTPMYITVDSAGGINIPLLVSIINRTRDKTKKYTSIRW